MPVHLIFTVERKGDEKMAKLGDNTPQIIDKAIDFMASSQAFREYLAHKRKSDRIPDDIPVEKIEMYRERLEHYRKLYRPACAEEEEAEQPGA
jgi:uncharacterized short protein YbdD (DUF466 family)